MKFITKPIGFVFGLLVGTFLVSTLTLVGLILLVVKFVGVDPSPFFDSITKYFDILRDMIDTA